MKQNESKKNPLNKYYNKKYPTQSQPYPGTQHKMRPVPDCGEDTYIGCDKLLNRRALITGGDSGIGRAVAIAFAREGADVAISYMPDEESDAREVAQYIMDAGRRAVLVPCDVADERACVKMVEVARRELRGLDIIVLNAGYQQYCESIMDLTTAQLRRTFDINLFSMFWTVRAALPYLKAGATIITTTSIQAYKPSAGLIDYACSKAAIKAFTHALAKQLAPRGIRVNGVAPGPIWTALQVVGGQKKSKIPEFGSDTPLRRAGQPAELAATYVLLASDASSYTTAEIYGVTGGDHTN